MTAARCVSTVLRLTPRMPGDLLVGVALGNQLDDLTLAGRENGFGPAGFLKERLQQSSDSDVKNDL